MRVHLEYGRTGLDVELPDANVVKTLGYTSAPPLADPAQAVRQALARPRGGRPLADLARRSRSACIVVSDITRPVPNAVILPPLLETLEHSGIDRQRILILLATGMHRPNLGDELAEVVGREVAAHYRVENHNGRDRSEHTFLGTSPRGIPVLVDTRYVESQLKITTGLIEPHFMAGFSGGRKLVCPGIAGQETIQHWHSPELLEDPAARSGSIEGNPVHEESTWIARRAGCDFIVNVVIDDRRRILAVEAGDMEEAFLAGCKFARGLATDTVAEPVDVVVTSGAGYPLDTTFYQCVKGMVAASAIVKPGGTIILAGSMSEGIGSTDFQRLFEENPSLEVFMDRIVRRDLVTVDQWQLEMLAKVRRKAKVKVVSDGLPPGMLGRLFVESAPSVEQAIADSLTEYGHGATIAAIPKGPYVLAELEGPQRP